MTGRHLAGMSVQEAPDDDTPRAPWQDDLDPLLVDPLETSDGAVETLLEAGYVVVPVNPDPIRHRPSNVAFPGPRSTNDAMPASRSLVANRPANSIRSISRPVSRSTPSPRSTASLAARSA